MNSRRGSTLSPISIVKMRSAAEASSIVTCASVREAGSIVVSRSCSAFISPSPLKRCSARAAAGHREGLLAQLLEGERLPECSPMRTSKGGVPAIETSSACTLTKRS